MKRVKKCVFLVRKGLCTISNKVKIRKSGRREGKLEIFSEKNVILVGENFFRPPQTRRQVPPLSSTITIKQKIIINKLVT